jgi:hypothetical protein
MIESAPNFIFSSSSGESVVFCQVPPELHAKPTAESSAHYRVLLRIVHRRRSAVALSELL